MIFRVEDRFKLTGRGIILTGRISDPKGIGLDSPVFAQNSDGSTYRGRIRGIERNLVLRVPPGLREGDSVGLLLSPQPDMIESGTAIYSGLPINVNHL